MCNKHVHSTVTRSSRFHSVMLTRPAVHEAEAETRKSEAEDEAEAQKIFRGRGHNV